MRDGIVIGVLLDQYGEIVISGRVDQVDRRPSTFVTAVIYPVVKVRRLGGSAASPEAPRSSCPLVGELRMERTDQREAGWAPDTGRRLEDQPANRRLWRVGPGGRPGSGPGLFDFSSETADQLRSSAWQGWWRRGDSNS